MQESDGLQQCPYEPSHRILPARFQVHLGRCRKNHKNIPKVTCPFNVTHVLNKPELDYHVTVCPERSAFEKFRHRDEIAAPSEAQASLQSKFALPPAEETGENWDDEPDVPSYNPQEYASNAKILRSLQGATPSERKAFRNQERKRLLGIKH